jgi:hypothetical protein
MKDRLRPFAKARIVERDRFCDRLSDDLSSTVDAGPIRAAAWVNFEKFCTRRNL